MFKPKEAPAPAPGPAAQMGGLPPLSAPQNHMAPQAQPPQFHRSESYQAPVQQTPPTPAFQQPKQPSFAPSAASPKPAFKIEINPDENKTIIIGGGDDNGSTMVLGYGGDQPGNAGSGKRTASITRRKNGQSMIINKEVFHMGKESSFADFFIGDNRTISAAHADIICDNGEYFIRDMNSLNHTFVNDAMVMAGEMKPLASGDVIRLSDEEFDFKIN